MLDFISPAELVSDFRYALDVLEEYRHLGLDDEHAQLLREILVRRIDETAVGLSGRSVNPLRLPDEIASL